MSNTADKLTYLVCLALVLILAVSSPPASASNPNQTIPTRTATPDVPPTPIGDTPAPPPPTDQPPPTAEPTNTPPAGPTATATLGVTLAPTPEGGFLPTAAPCNPNPTLQAQGRMNVRSGPGLDYDVVGQLNFLEVRPIIGRAANSAWWQIILADGAIGWGADAVVLVHGYTQLVPVIPPPPLPDGSTPTPGPAWNPTPNPVCTPLPTYTPTATPTWTPGATPPPSATATAVGEVAAAGDTVTPDPAAPTPRPTLSLDTATPRPTLTATPPAAPSPASQQTATGPAGIGWLPLAGVGLILAGLAVYVIRRR